ncbi:hypothetical protein PI87_17685 [Ralstonia sp. A12]|nr:hypothetical protein PI87_17685 [Ralstonia sp. A12]
MPHRRVFGRDTKKPAELVSPGFFSACVSLSMPPCLHAVNPMDESGYAGTIKGRFLHLTLDFIA